MRAPAVVPRKNVAQVPARSISRPVWEELLEADRNAEAGRVSALFERACYLAIPGGEPIALVWPEIDDGPLSLVLEEPPGAWPAVGTPVQPRPGKGRLEIAGFQVTLDGATVWEPRPDWGRLRAQAGSIQARLSRLTSIVLLLAPRDSLVSILAREAPEQGAPGHVPSADTGRGWSRSIAPAVADAARLLSLGWAGDWALLGTAASRLAGLGGGLTPSGDDFLLGAMIWAWLAHPAPERICGPLLEAAQSRTTALSAALLRAAGRGECSQPWHHLLDVLRCRPDGELVAAVQAMLGFGHTSGADALVGLLWVGLHTSLI